MDNYPLQIISGVARKVGRASTQTILIGHPSPLIRVEMLALTYMH